MSAPELSAEERRRVAEFDAAPEPPEITRERVAVTIAGVSYSDDVVKPDDYALADRVIAIMRGER